MDKKEWIRETAIGRGADFFGVADVDPFRRDKRVQDGLLGSFKSAISLGVALSREIFNNLVDGPTLHYSHHYQTANTLLDSIAFRVSGAIQKQGGKALPIPASQIVNRESWLGAISHKAVARMAGIGWQGKSLLLVNPKVGPRIRLVTVLTDWELPIDKPLKNGCGKCMECTKGCPAGAIKGVPFGDGYEKRSDAWEVDKCTKWVLEKTETSIGTSSLICGMCIKACPIGRTDKAYADSPGWE